MLERFRSRAGELDRTNAYFADDLAELRRHRLPRRRRARRARRLGPRPRRAGREPAPPRPLCPGDSAGDDACTPTGSASPSSSSGPATRRCGGSSTRRWQGDVFAAGHAESRQRHPRAAVDLPGRAGRRRLPPHRPQAVRLERPGVAVARRPRDRRRRAGRPADRARLRRPHERGRDRRGDLGHARHAARRRATTRCSTACSCPTPAIGAGGARRRRQRPVPRRDEHLAAVADGGGVPRDRRPGARARGRRRAAQDVDGDRARRLRLQPVRAAPDRRDVPRARRRLGDARPVRHRLGGRRRSRRRLDAEGVLGEVASGRGGQAGRRRRARRGRAAPGCSSATSWSGSTATSAAAAFTPATTRSPTSSSARPCSASSSEQPRW